MKQEKKREEPGLGGASLHGLCEACEVRGLAVCSGLNSASLLKLNRVTTQTRFDEGQTVIFEGDSATRSFILKSGVMRLSKMLADGRRQIIGFLFPGDFLGLGHSETYSYSAEALTPVTLCRIEQSRLPQLFEEIPGLEANILAAASDEISHVRQQLLTLGRKTARERVATFLVQIACQAERHGQPRSPLELPMSRADIADYIGLTVETVSRTLSRMSKDGIIRLDTPHCVCILAWERLNAIAAGDEAQA